MPIFCVTIKPHVLVDQKIFFDAFNPMFYIEIKFEKSDRVGKGLSETFCGIQQVLLSYRERVLVLFQQKKRIFDVDPWGRIGSIHTHILIADDSWCIVLVVCNL